MLQRRLAAKAAIHPHIVTRVVFMVGIGLKNGTEIDDLDAERGKVVQFLGHAPQVSAEMDMIGQRCTCIGGILGNTVLPIGVEFGRASSLAAGGLARTAEEAIHEHVIHHALAKPSGRGKIGAMDEQAEGRAAVSDPLEIHVVAGIRKQSVGIAHKQEAVVKKAVVLLSA